MPKSHAVVDNLTLATAQAILSNLAKSDVARALRIAALAPAIAEEVEPNAVADALYQELNALPIE